MGLARAWRRRLYASVGLAVVVPAALMISLALLAVGGGSLSLASLKQLVSGPGAPAVAPVALGAPSGRTLGGRSASGPAGTALVASVTAPGGAGPSRGAGARSSHHGSGSAPAGGRGTGGSGSGGTGGGSGGGGGGQSGGGGGGGSGGGGGGKSGGGGGGSGGGGGGNSGGGGGTHPPKHQTVVDRVVKSVTHVTSNLPAPAGPLVTQVVNSVGSVADQVLKKLPHK